jgi:hypothetical protein
MVLRQYMFYKLVSNVSFCPFFIKIYELYAYIGRSICSSFYLISKTIKQIKLNLLLEAL